MTTTIVFPEALRLLAPLLRTRRPLLARELIVLIMSQRWNGDKHMLDGRLHGIVRTTWHSSAFCHVVDEPWMFGENTGPARSYTASGSLHSEYCRLRGMLHGQMRVYDATKLVREANYYHGLLDGEDRRYAHTTGELMLMSVTRYDLGTFVQSRSIPATFDQAPTK